MSLRSQTAPERLADFRAGNPDPRVEANQTLERELRHDHLVESGQAVADLEAIKADCGGVWHPAWEARLVSAKARQEAARQATVVKASQFMSRAA